MSNHTSIGNMAKKISRDDYQSTTQSVNIQLVKDMQRPKKRTRALSRLSSSGVDTPTGRNQHRIYKEGESLVSDNATSFASTSFVASGNCCADMSLRVLYPLASQQSKSISVILSLFHLKFRKFELEQRYAIFVSRTFPPRIHSVAIFMSVLVITFWVLLGVSMALSALDCPVPIAVPTFHIVVSLCLIAAGLLFLVPKIPVLKQNCEISIYCIYGTVKKRFKKISTSVGFRFLDS